MSTAFKEFLEKQVSKHEAVKEKVAEWRTAIEELFSQIRGWLKESDPNGVIEIEEGDEDINEPSLGRYRVPRLDLRVVGKWVGIIPVARRSVDSIKPPHKQAPERAEGRVDITDDLHRFVLYRYREGGQNKWLIDDLGRSTVFAPAKPFDQNEFEQVLMSYFR